MKYMHLGFSLITIEDIILSDLNALATVVKECFCNFVHVFV